jgi:glutaredoxin-like YruB-family protein
MDKELKKATFAGGCFWCMQPPFRNLEGVTDVVSGYAGGAKPNPSYEEVSSGTTGHLEAVQVMYDPDEISFDQLLDVFWHQIDPTDAEGQFADKGSQYHTAIFYHDDEQKRLAESSKMNLDSSGKFKKPVATEIRPYTNFYPAEEYHQDYDKKKPGQYHTYKTLSGRESFIRKAWGTGKKEVKVYSTPGCNNCRMTKEFLKSKSIDFEDINIAENEDARNLLIEKSGYIGAPVIQIGDQFVFGFDRKKIESLLG